MYMDCIGFEDIWTNNRVVMEITKLHIKSERIRTLNTSINIQ